MDEKTLKKNRACIKTKLTIFSNFLKRFENTETKTDVDIFQLTERLNKATSFLDEFEEIQAAIDAQTDDVDNQLREREDFTNEFYAQIAKARQLANNLKSNISGELNSSVGTSQELPINNIKLPIIQLPEFNGDLQDWLKFRDTFESLIHNNSATSDIQKFHYLRAALKGSAATVIEALEFSASNYAIAWTALLERYNNEKLLIQNHVKALFNVEPITKESSARLRTLLDVITKDLRALEQLNEPVEHWDTLIVYLFTTKLDYNTEREWEQHKATLKERPSLEVFKRFLRNRADFLESVEGGQADKKHNTSKQNTKGFLATEQRTAHCVFCKKDHYIQKCNDFLKLNNEERTKRIKTLKICLNCLRAGHFIKDCRSSLCRKCDQKHHTLLHIDKAKDSTTKSQDTPTTTCTSTQCAQQVLLSTALIQIFDKTGKLHTARALLDSGSQSSFITQEFCNRLNLETEPFNLSVTGINQTASTIKAKCKVTIQAQHNAFTVDLICYTLPSITGNLPNIRINAQELNIPKTIRLADPSFYKPDKIDMLIGAEVFWKLICVGQIPLGPKLPVLQKSRFGWLISGTISSPTTQNISCNFSREMEVQNQLTRFWEIEEVSSKNPLSQEQLLCEKHFVETVERDADGRFVVKFPFKESTDKLGESKIQAEKRFFNLERKLNVNEKLKQLYCQFMEEYIASGHMVKIKIEEKEPFSTYYMPHHGVLREGSLTTKLRAVFDCSASTSSGYSLNDLQMVGPTIQPELFTLLVRFRQHEIVIAGDIEKMYRQCVLSPDQRQLQRLFWRKDPSQPLELYEMTRLTYGNTSAPFLAVRCLKELAINHKTRYPEAANIIESNFYVDDLLTGFDDAETAGRVCKEITTLLRTGGFKIKKFYSNYPHVLEEIKDEMEENQILKFGEQEAAKTLGLAWIPHTDELVYNITNTTVTRVTKRVVLSTIAKIFDPLGLLSPCTIIAKQIMQKLWLEKLTWDETLPLNLHTKWCEFDAAIQELNQLKLARHVICKNPKAVEIHGFSDASEMAYGCCVYIRAEDQNSQIFTKLLCAKARVAPLKCISLPRLELCGALMLARLVQKVTESLTVRINRRVLWTDSTIVLGWIKLIPNTLKAFIGNRTAEIQRITENDTWNHVRSGDNPADLVSRGVEPNKIQNQKLWWQGPRWLTEAPDNWPRLPIIPDDLPELRKNKVCFVSLSLESAIAIERHSNLKTLLHILAYCYRFGTNCKIPKNERKFASFTVDEINKAFKALIKFSQLESFQQEIDALQKKKQVPKKSTIASLHPFLDPEGVLRVGGRLQNTEWSYEEQHPILLEQKNHLTKLIAMDEHKKLKHPGPQLLLSTLRQRFWIPSGRSFVRKITHQCVICFRAKPRFIQPMMGNLPAERVCPQPPFYNSGVDYAGPFLLKSKKGRGCTVTKVYISLFVCLVTKAVHLELVTDLSKDSFLLALKRFISRRGKPYNMVSDNGRNFVAARSDLAELGKFLQSNHDAIIQSCADENINWKFIPPYAPHMGGIWEAGVRSVKHHLRRTLKTMKMTFEEFYTILTEIEAILNSRPLTPMSSNPSDLSPLTPAHFLIGRPFTTIPESSVMELPENRLSRYQHLLKLKQHFWTRWHKEYLSELQERSKWKQTDGTVENGALVLIKEDNVPVMQWKLGRVQTLHSGKDGITRVVSVCTASGVVKRAVNRICPLPITVCNDSLKD